MPGIITAVIPAAGKGTRLKPYTDSTPKEMLFVGGKPILQYIIDEAISSGIRKLIIIISREKEFIKSYFSREDSILRKLEDENHLYALKSLENMPNYLEFFFVYQEQQLGLGHAVLQAKKYIEEDRFAVLLGDSFFAPGQKPAFLNLIEAEKKYPGNMIALKEVLESDISRYGIAEIEKEMDQAIYSIAALLEKPMQGVTNSNLAVAGRYILQKSVFNYLEITKTGVGGEIQLTDAIQAMMTTIPLYGRVISEQRFDIGSVENYLMTKKILEKGF